MKIFKTIVSSVSVCMITFSAVSANTLAGEIYDFTEKEISASLVKPVITINSQLISKEDAENNKTAEISIDVRDANMNYASTGLHIYYDSRLQIATNSQGYPDIKPGYALKYMMSDYTIDNEITDSDMKSVFLASSGNTCYGMDGTMWTIRFELPDNVQQGDVFPIDISYRKSDDTADIFSNVTNNKTGQLMSAYTFTRGIYNGFETNFIADAEHIEKCPTLADVPGYIDGYIAVEALYSNIVYGDANTDGNINVADATAIIQHIGNQDEYGLSEKGLENADANGDNQVTGMDAIIIQQVIAGIYNISDLPVRV